MTEAQAWFALGVAELSARTVRNLLECFGSAAATVAADLSAVLETVPMRPAELTRFRAAREGSYDEAWETMARLGVQVVSLRDPAYPFSLQHIPDPPPVLFLRGSLLPQDRCAVAIVGTRRATPYGLLASETLARGLAARGVTVVSGLAVGADAAAHRGALAVGGRTIGVLACGIDLPYPRDTLELREQMATQGAVLTEVPLGVPAQRSRFPARNRIISGLSLGVVVTEAPDRSGALITADFAGEHGRQVFAVPGSVNSQFSRGTHALLRDGARLVESVEDILDELDLSLPAPEAAPALAPAAPIPAPPPVTLTGDERTLAEALSLQPRHVDDIIVTCGIPSSRVSAGLLMLELKGLVRRLPGNMFTRPVTDARLRPGAAPTRVAPAAGTVRGRGTETRHVSECPLDRKRTMAKALIIVESPAKTRTIRQFVGKDYEIEASLGHVRDLPKSKMGVDVENDFAPQYIALRDRSSVLKKLGAAVKKADRVFLATDPDREGEAIAWHLVQALKIKDPQRIQFNEITRRAVTEALAHPREVDMKRVNAQQARRVLDRLVGYTLSPLLQKKMHKWNLSAGRVQSVAVRLICEREREIQAFVPDEYWDVFAQVTTGAEEDAFELKLMDRDGAKVRLTDFDQAQEAIAEIWESQLQVSRVKVTDHNRRPPAPFTTSTLQQEAANRLGMSARRTMRVAQSLYEGLEMGEEGHVGLITYMRTDSTRVAEEAQVAAREYINAEWGTEYAPAQVRQHQSRAGAQEGHEAIRPTSPGRTPEQVAELLKDDEQTRLYRLIWNRFMASQMADLRLRITTADIAAGRYSLRGRGVHLLFPGFTVVYPTRETESVIPALTEGMVLDLLGLSSQQKFTEPPARYSEASLVRALEAKGIGRPSTYAAIIGTIQDRGYVYLEQKHFYPTDLGFAVTDQLVAHFPDIINVEFTADMESKLDHVEEGEADWVRTLQDFYTPFKIRLDAAEEAMQDVRLKPQETDEVCDLCGKSMVLRVGKRGPFLACSGYPEWKNTRPVAGSEGDGKPARVPAEPTDQVCEKCGSPMVIRTGKRGRFLACSGYPKCRNAKPLPEEEAAAAALAANEKCDLCGAPMAVRRGRFGPFLGCTAYPECRGIKKLPKPEAPSDGPSDDASDEADAQSEV